MGVTESGEMKGLTPSVSVIVPCFNEQDNVVACVDQVGRALKSAGITHEVLVVNDGSTDETLERAHSLITSASSVRVIDLGENCGKAVALKEGLRRARGDIIAFFDADLQYSPKDLVTMIGRLNDGPDFVNGTRDYNGYGVSRTAFSRLYNRAVRFLFRMQLRDSNCGIKVLRKEAADAETIFNYGLPLVVPLLKIRGFESTEVPVTLHERRNGESKYFQDGHFLGGSRNIRDIAYHSIMLVNLLAHAPFESMRQDNGSGKNVGS